MNVNWICDYFYLKKRTILNIVGRIKYFSMICLLPSVCLTLHTPLTVIKTFTEHTNYVLYTHAFLHGPLPPVQGNSHANEHRPSSIQHTYFRFLHYTWPWTPSLKNFHQSLN